MENKDYIDILVQSLEKKTTHLQIIKEHNEAQYKILQSEEVDLDEWEASANAKQKEIDEINLLDEGFDEVYEKVKEELNLNRSLYADKIEQMQKLIGQITAYTVDIKAQELRNKELAQVQFGRLKKKTKTMRQSNRAAQLYKNSMRKLNLVDPQFMDRKN